MEFFFVSCNLAKKSEKKKNENENSYWGGAGTLWGRDGGRKFPRERGGAGMGDGVGITGRGIRSPPQTRPIAIPKQGCFVMDIGHLS